jgi:hypothetical protein
MANLATRSMTQKYFIAGFVLLGAICALFWLVVKNPPPPPARSLVFTTGLISRRSDGSIYTVTVSNTTANTVEYNEGFHTVWFTIAFLSNGQWQTTNLTTPGSELALLPPHGIAQNPILVPEGASSFKVGLLTTSLSWRGEFAWSIVQSRYFYGLRGLTTPLFLVPDERSRTVMEWSDEQSSASR